MLTYSQVATRLFTHRQLVNKLWICRRITHFSCVYWGTGRTQEHTCSILTHVRIFWNLSDDYLKACNMTFLQLKSNMAFSTWFSRGIRFSRSEKVNYTHCSAKAATCWMLISCCYLLTFSLRCWTLLQENIHSLVSVVISIAQICKWIRERTHHLSMK